VIACVTAEIPTEILPLRHRTVWGYIIVQDQYYSKQKQIARQSAAVKQIPAEFLKKAVVYSK
jgi:hypothetical protein